MSAWTTGGSASKVALNLTAAPSGLAPKFTVGCTPDGKASCDLGTVDANSAKRQLQAQVAVAANATSVGSVELTVTGSATGLTKKPAAAATITVTAQSATASASVGSTSAVAGTSAAGAAGQVPGTNVTSPLPVTSLPYLSSAAPSTLSPGGNASGLFPTLNPSGGAAADQKAGVTRTRSVADEASLRSNASVMGAQLAGLIALSLAFILAVTRLSIRRRPGTGKPTANGPR